MEAQGFATTFFNRTIDIVEKPRIVDLELIFLYLLLLALLGGGGTTLLLRAKNWLTASHHPTAAVVYFQLTLITKDICTIFAV